MPTDDYTAVGGGGLRIKGAKVHKKKKKKKTKTPDAERALAAAADDDKAPATEDEPAAGSAQRRGADAHADAPPDDAAALKTDAERRYDEIKRKRLLDMARSSGARPELLKTHKERVEELNTYLSKLSEHHDMPKIGPG